MPYAADMGSVWNGNVHVWYMLISSGKLCGDSLFLIVLKDTDGHTLMCSLYQIACEHAKQTTLRWSVMRQVLLVIDRCNDQHS